MQLATERPDPTPQRKAAIATGAVRDHAGAVTVRPIDDFDLDRTIFQTLEGKAQRFVMKTRVGKHVDWADDAEARIEQAYQQARHDVALPEIDAGLLRFMVEECDFDVEHADGSFLDHLYFCFEYTVAHYPGQSPIVMLLHSILGTGTNTFAMTADRIPALRALVGQREWLHIEAFPSVLRLLYDLPLRQELRANLHRIDQLKSIRMRRVIDNAPIELSASELWVALNYQLIHLVDFLPVANWVAWSNDTSFIVFRDLYDLLERAGKREALVEYHPPAGPHQLQGEDLPLPGRLTSRIPVGLSEKMAARSVRTFSERAGHDISYAIDWG
ncbi:MAG: hypothetical protein H6742_16620 [Alphaproteobacteria bacterium]|nr:hypothetical protein [Alphaproteobacteria bacterium]